MNLSNKKGFSFIEVIIGLIIFGLIVSSFSYLFSLNLDLPIVEEREKALFYAKKEMEKLNNRSFQNILPILKNPYPEDNSFDYEVEVNLIEPNKKEVRVKFYKGNSNDILVELYTQFFNLETKICDDFEVNGLNAPPWNWEVNPPGQWGVINLGGTHGNVLSYRRIQSGTAYTMDYLSSNYSVNYDIYVQSVLSIYYSSTNFVGGRCDTNGSGYYVRINLSYFILYGYRLNISLVRVDNGNFNSPTFLHIYPTINENYFDRWFSVKLEMNGTTLRYYLNKQLLGTVNDSTYSNGGLFIRAQSTSNQRYVYFDNICVESLQ